MAIEKVVNVKVNTKEAVTETEKLTKAVENLSDIQVDANKQAEKSAEDAKKRIEEQNKALENSRKPLNRLKTGFKGLGTAIKATGIGLLIGALAGLSSAFNSNTAVSKVFKETFETINLIFGEFVGGIVNAIKEVGKANNNFKALGKVISGLLNLGLNPLRASFLAMGQAINVAKLAWEKSFLGSRDPKVIEQLQKDIKETGDEISDLAKQFKKSGEDVWNNFGQAVKETFEVVNKAVDNTTKVSIKNANNLAKQLVKMREESQIAIATNELILKTKQKEAEEQRIIRDNVELDIATRTKANKELKKILKESNDLQIANAQKTIDLAKLEKKASGGILQSRLDLLNAELQYQDVLETTKGFLAEQDTNRASLNAEAIELENSRIEAEAERAKSKRDFESEQIQNEVKRIEQQKANLKIENQTIEDDIERKRLLYAEGTQARLDAEQEYLDKKQELSQKEIQLDTQASETKKKTAKAEEDFKVNLATGTLGLLSSVAKEGSALAKGVAVAQATISTFQGINKALAETTDFTPTQSLRFANAAIVGASGFANIASILSTDTSGQSIPSAPSQSPAVTAPSFNLVAGTGTDQIADSIQNQDRPIKAFVVSSDVTTQQSLDRNAVETASL